MLFLRNNGESMCNSRLFHFVSRTPPNSDDLTLRIRLVLGVLFEPWSETLWSSVRRFSADRLSIRRLLAASFDSAGTSDGDGFVSLSAVSTLGDSYPARLAVDALDRRAGLDDGPRFLQADLRLDSLT